MGVKQVVVYMGTVLYPLLFFKQINPIWLLVFALVSSASFVCLFCCFCISWLSSGEEVEDYIKCELIGGGYPRHLDTFPTFCCCWLYTHINIMYCSYC